MSGYSLTNGGVVAFSSSADVSTAASFTYHSTGTDAMPWITIDLGAQFTLSAVQIWNRWDCCWNQFMWQFQILVGNNPGPVQGTAGTSALNFNPACFVQSTDLIFTAYGYGIYGCVATGRYVTVQRLAGTITNMNNLRAILVYGVCANIIPPAVTAGNSCGARAGTSLAYSGYSGTSVVTSGFYSGSSAASFLAYSTAAAVASAPSWNYHSSCSDSLPWFTIDLGAVFTLTSVQIYNRVDWCD